MTRKRRAHVISIGTFDGVHLGHQAILAEVRRLADLLDADGMAYTFGVPPRASRMEDLERTLLLPWSVREAWLRRFVDRVECVTFSRVRDLSAEAFVGSLIESWNARAVVVGTGFRFGAGRSGDTAALQQLASRRGVRVVVVPPIVVDGAPVSSTRIRGLLAEGRVEEAAACLGRPPTLHGPVVSGDRIGRQLGFPTANLRIGRRILLPRFGVYLVDARHGDIRSHGLLYVGQRPTIAGASDLRCEVHLLTPPAGSLLGRTMDVALLEPIRGDMRFSTREALRDQIAADIEQARRRVSGRRESADPFAG